MVKTSAMIAAPIAFVIIATVVIIVALIAAKVKKINKMNAIPARARDMVKILGNWMDEPEPQ